MIHPSIIAICIIAQVVEDVILYPFKACYAAKAIVTDALRHSVSISGYTATDLNS